MITNCTHCNIEFKSKEKSAKFCSRSCAASFNNKGVRRNPLSIRRTCECGNVKDPKSTRCNSCKLDSMKELSFEKTIKDLTIGIDTTIKFNSIRKHARKVMIWNNIPKTCTLCKHNEFDAVAEVCHIKPLSSFEETTTLR